MTATSENSKVKRSGRGLTIAKALKAHLTAEGTYSEKVRRTWDEWFEHAWPTTAAELAVFVDSAKDGCNVLLLRKFSESSPAACGYDLLRKFGGALPC